MRLFGGLSDRGSGMRVEDMIYISHLIDSLSTRRATNIVFPLNLTAIFAHGGSEGSGSESAHTSQKFLLSVPGKEHSESSYGVYRA